MSEQKKAHRFEKMNRPLDEIKEDIFRRPDSFQNEPWV